MNRDHEPTTEDLCLDLAGALNAYVERVKRDNDVEALDYLIFWLDEDLAGLRDLLLAWKAVRSAADLDEIAWGYDSPTLRDLAEEVRAVLDEIRAGAGRESEVDVGANDRCPDPRAETPTVQTIHHDDSASSSVERSTDTAPPDEDGEP